VVKLGVQTERSHTHPQITNEILLVLVPASVIVDMSSVRYFDFVSNRFKAGNVWT